MTKKLFKINSTDDEMRGCGRRSHVGDWANNGPFEAIGVQFGDGQFGSVRFGNGQFENFRSGRGSYAPEEIGENNNTA